MKKMLVILMGALFSLSAYANDPMGLSEYTIHEITPDRQSYIERRLTNHEVWLFQQTGVILPDGSLSEETNMLEKKPLNSKPPKVDVKEPSTAQASTQPIIKKKPLPTSGQIATQTNTKPASHPESKGTVHVRPTTMPKNPSRDDIVRMQQHIQHIERRVAKALDLSLSAYAVAELPQATEGRSSVSFGAAAADGESAVAAGYSSNFGAKHEYTVKISLSHAGHEEAVGAGIGYQW